MATTTAAFERRHFQRARLDTYMNKIIRDQAYMVRVRDISCGGLFLYKLIEPTLIEVHDEIGLEFMLPEHNQVIWASGRLIREERSESDGSAIAFAQIRPRDRELIHQYVCTH